LWQNLPADLQYYISWYINSMKCRPNPDPIPIPNPNRNLNPESLHRVESPVTRNLTRWFSSLGQVSNSWFSKIVMEIPLVCKVSKEGPSDHRPDGGYAIPRVIIFTANANKRKRTWGSTLHKNGFVFWWPETHRNRVRHSDRCIHRTPWNYANAETPLFGEGIPYCYKKTK